MSGYDFSQMGIFGDSHLVIDDSGHRVIGMEGYDSDGHQIWFIDTDGVMDEFPKDIFIDENKSHFAFTGPGPNDYGSILNNFPVLHVPGSQSTLVMGQNPEIAVATTEVGSFVDAQGLTHGFVYDVKSGKYTQIDAPGKGSHSTMVEGVNASGELVGTYLNHSDLPIDFTASLGNNPNFGFGGNIGHDNFWVSDQTNGLDWQTAGDSYDGPVGGTSDQFITINSDNLNVTSEEKNVFIHTGSGEDAINVQAMGGNNILDGGTGSNFLVGGSGNDTFFADDRAPSSSLWSTLVGFHAGDAATIFGITKDDFSLAWVDNQGADKFTGLTAHLTANGVPTASVTIAGYSMADLSNGRVQVSFGRTVDLPGLTGSTFMQITGH